MAEKVPTPVPYYPAPIDCPSKGSDAGLLGSVFNKRFSNLLDMVTRRTYAMAFCLVVVSWAPVVITAFQVEAFDPVRPSLRRVVVRVVSSVLMRGLLAAEEVQSFGSPKVLELHRQQNPLVLSKPVQPRVPPFLQPWVDL